MFSIREIIRKNRETQYNYSTGKLSPVWKWYLFLLAISALIPALVPNDFSKFVEAVITSQSILVGFSFSVLFFLLSEKKEKLPTDVSLERKLKNRKLTKLSKELFYNVSYFNLTALSCVCTALVITITPHIDFNTVRNFVDFNSLIPTRFHADIAETTSYAVATIKYAIKFLFFLTLLESLFTFGRTIRRVIFYFEDSISQVEEKK